MPLTQAKTQRTTKAVAHTRQTPPATAVLHPRVGSKQALLVDLLTKPEGATLAAMSDATGWLAHTTRAALTGLRKRGFAIAHEPADDGRAIYRIHPLRKASRAKTPSKRRAQARA
jgi:hypothetical protein